MSQGIEVNSIVEGKVIKVKPFGAIVLLPDKSQGLVHISHISSKYVQDINDFVAVGDAVMVKVMSVDNENNRISLSIKEAGSQRAVQQEERRPRTFLNEERMPPQLNTFDEKLKDWIKSANERQAGINKRNKRR
ncbi:MAG: S1 RNA-binding domain-containing protein [Clostridiales bacterium]|jgi:predicted RNA-binding protein with RPS1 domain|nr:S1 RNA-binding domain-containing protein [Clostridiales bacterium]